LPPKRRSASASRPSPAARDDTRAVCYAVYGDRAYLLNVDCAGPRAVDVLVGDAPPRRLELAPLALETVGL